MNSDIPKQYIVLAGKPVLMHTIEAFRFSKYCPEIVVVLNPTYTSFWEKLCREYSFSIPHKIVRGGENRFYSVKNGLEVLDNNSLVAIHDAVRPLITNQAITRGFDKAYALGNACCAVASKDSVRQKQSSGETVALSRDTISLMQTPQTFKTGLIKKAYNKAYSSTFTDDASVLEQDGVIINLIEGEFTNLKITYPEDLAIAEIWAKKNPTF
jgi:2-C-methyl-D-erythritol 4-phosphate cytidylyltransferase